MLNYSAWMTVVHDTLQLYSMICYVSQLMADRKCHTKRHLKLQDNAVGCTTFLVWLTCWLGLFWCSSVLQSVCFFTYAIWACSYSVPTLYYCSIVFYSLCKQLFGGVTCFHAMMFTILCLLPLFCIRLVLASSLCFVLNWFLSHVGFLVV